MSWQFNLYETAFGMDWRAYMFGPDCTLGFCNTVVVMTSNLGGQMAGDD